MSNPNAPGGKPADTPPTSESLKELVNAPLHEAVFGNDPDGFVNDTPPGAIGENVNFIGGGVQLDTNQPLRHIGDSDAGDFQPGGGRRR